jgi:hypothetical protein
MSSFGATKVPAHVWRMIIASVGRNASGRARNLLMLLTVNKEIVRLAREELVKLGRLMIQCTVSQIPHAIGAFPTATEMRVVGSKTERNVESEERAASDASAASDALAATGTRFRLLESDHTDESNMGWLPQQNMLAQQQKMLGQQQKKPSEERGEPSQDRGGGARDQNEEEEGRCVVVCNVSATRFSGPKVGNVAGFYRTGRMGELVIRHRGLRNHGLPDLSLFDSDDSDGPVGPLRVTIENGAFHGLDDGRDGPKFRSPVVTGLTFTGCDLVLLPSVSGFRGLKRLDVTNCYFNDYDALRLLSADIEYLRVERCGGELDGSPIAGLTKLKTLVMTDYTTGEFPEFDEAARVSLHGRLVGGELNGNGRGYLCKEIARRLQVECCAGLAMCDVDCYCCGDCSDSE